MKRFIIKIFLFGISFITPLYIIDYYKTIDYQSRNYYPFSTWNDIVNGRLKSDLWILGSSRAWNHYNPKILDSLLNVSSYNLGCNAQFIYLDLQCYEIAREYNPKPKRILLDLTWQSLTMDISPISRYNYMPYIYKRKFRNIIKKNNNITLSYLYIPYYRYISEQKADLWFENYSENEYKGFKKKHLHWGTDMIVLDTVHYYCEKDAINLLYNFLKECKKDSISVIIIHSPFYYEGFEQIPNHNQMIELFQGIAENNGVPFLDYSNSSICYDTMNFYNAMHLNARGSDLFSKQLAHDLDSLGLIPARR